MKKNLAIVIDKKDDVATALVDLKSGQKVEIDFENRTIDTILINNIPIYHKFALRNFEIGEKIYKYGQVIGEATQKINAGEHVHTHNIKSLRGEGNEV